MALRLAGDLMFNLTTFGLAHDRPTLVRGGLAFGDVEHVRNVFLTDANEPATWSVLAFSKPLNWRRWVKGRASSLLRSS